MRSTIWLYLFAAVLFSSVILMGCGDENPVPPDDDDPVITVDTIPPATVATLALRSPTTSAISLVWNAPGDDGVKGQATAYDIRYATYRITDQNWDMATPVANLPPPRPAGQLETVVVPGLKSVTRYYFALKTMDEVPNTSLLSNCPDTVTLQEHNPPAAVSDLRGIALNESDIILTWTAPGDDGTYGVAAQYDVRFTYHPFNIVGWNGAIQLSGEPAPSPGGEPDSFLVSGFPADSSFYFAIRTADEVPNWSSMSNTTLVLGYEINLDVVPETIFDEEEVIIHFRASTSKVDIKVWQLSWWGDDFVFRSLVSKVYEPGAHSISWDVRGDDGRRATSWYYRVELKWGNTLVAEIPIRVM